MTIKRPDRTSWPVDFSLSGWVKLLAGILSGTLAIVVHVERRFSALEAGQAHLIGAVGRIEQRLDRIDRMSRIEQHQIEGLCLKLGVPWPMDPETDSERAERANPKTARLPVPTRERDD